MAFLVDLAPAAGAVTDIVTGVSMPDIDLNFWISPLIAIVVLAVVWWFVTTYFKSQLLEQLQSNWRLALLGATGIVLSLASGWTTWDGMRNFTQEPVLSLMITFGIQGVMLIVAWLIGESFATGMTQRAAVGPAAVTGSYERRGGPNTMPQVMGAIIGVLIAFGLALLVFDAFGVNDPDASRASPLTGLPMNGVLAVLVILLAVGILITAGTDILGDYKQALRIMVRSSVLWVMFLACMATSVFFSFDSLFSTIFPQQERERAAALRAQNQVAGVVNDIGAIAVRRRIQETEDLFNTPGWASYDRELDKVIALANKSPDLIRAQIASELEKQRSRVAALEEKRATAEGSQASLVARKTRLTEELDRISGDRPEASTNVAAFKAQITEIDKRLDEARAVMLAEERGVEGSGRAGRGPMWRAARADVGRIEAEKEVAERRLKGHADRLEQIDSRTSSIKAQLAQIDADLANLRGEAQTAEQLIGVAQTNAAADDTQRFDPAASVSALEKARQGFRQEPTQERLARLQSVCLDLQNAGLKVRALADESARIDCDPGVASESASRVFALNTGITALRANCIGGSKLPQSGGADALFSFARRCVQDSGLPSDATDALRTRINIIELNRDDKAHRFVVTTNAFGDGNKLAYLALAIAIAIDSLVFMSGLFGANSVRSPLTDVPSHKGRSAKQLEEIVEHALLPDKFDAATLTLEAVHPMTRDLTAPTVDGWTHEVVVPLIDTPGKVRLLKVLNAGATISAVARDPQNPQRYFVRGEFVEFLAGVAKRAFETDEGRVRLAELKKILSVALQPDLGDNADLVIGYLRPISDKDGWSSEVCLRRDVVDAGHRFVVQKAINAGTTLDFVQKDNREGEESRFYLHKDFYRALVTIAAEAPKGTAAARKAAELAEARAQAAAQARAEAQYGAEEAAAVRAAAQSVAPKPHSTPPIPTSVPAPQPFPRPDAYPAETGRLTRAEAIEEFLIALGISAEQHRWALANAGTANNANQAINELIENNDRLGALVDSIARDAGDALTLAHSALEQQHASDANADRLLIAARREIDDILPLLLIAPQGRYHRVVANAIAEFEAAAGHADGLRPNEADQLQRLRAHHDAMAKVATAETAVDSIQDYLGQGPANGLDNVAFLQPRNAAGES